MKKKTGLSLFASVIAVLTISGIGSTASAYGPLTMYTAVTDFYDVGSSYPRALELQYSGSANGTMLSTFEKHEEDDRYIPIYRSTDQGLTWTEIAQVEDAIGAGELGWQPFLYELPQQIGTMPAGTLLLAATAIDLVSTTTTIETYKSTDHGTTWTYVSTLDTGPSCCVGNDPVWEAFLMVADDKLIAYYSDERDPDHSQTLIHRATTDGVTWGPIVEDVALSDSNLRPGMTVVAEMGNGNYIMTYEMVNDPNHGSGLYYKISADADDFGDPALPGTLLTTTTGQNSGGTPYVIWTPMGGPNGAVVASAYFTNELFINYEYGAAGKWQTLSTVVPAGYSRSMTPMSDGNLFVVSAVDRPDGKRDIQYGTTAIPGMKVNTGLDAVGSTADDPISNAMVAAKVTAAQNTAVNQLNLYNESGGVGTVRLGIYSDNGGNPGTLLAQTTDLAVTNGWVRGGIPSTSLTSGQTYWLVYNFSQNGNHPKYNSTGTGSYKAIAASYGSMPSAAPTGWGTANLTVSFYASGWDVRTGLDTIGTTADNPISNAMVATKVKPGQDTTVSKLNLYNESGAVGTVRLGIYSDNGGNPGTLLAQTTDLAVTNGWISGSVPSTSLMSGQTYWLIYNFSQTGNHPKYNSTGTGSYKAIAASYGSMPSTAPTGWGTANLTVSFYASN